MSVIDVKAPAIFDGDSPTANEHLCLAHYLIDGHHKVDAASLEQKPITLLSFVAVDAGTSTEEEQQTLLQALR